MRRLSQCIALATSFAIVGCSPSPAQHLKDVPLGLPVGWVAAENKEQGLRVGVPPGWREGSGLTSGVSQVMSDMGGDPSALNADPAISQMLGQMEEANRLEEAKEMEKLAAKNIFIHCIDGSRPIIGEERTRFYVKRIDRGSGASLDAEAQIEAQTVSGEKKTVELPIGKAIRLDSKITTRGGDEVYRTSYVTVDGSKVYILRFVTTGNPSSIRDIADGVAQTLRVKPDKS